MNLCIQCPRECKTDRESKIGFCGVTDALSVAKIMLHEWEEPCICHGAGAGAIFFSGCNLHCLYCQNCKISGGERGEIMTDAELEEKIIELRDAGASCIDLVTPTHYTERLIRILRSVKPRLNIPVVWNSSGYEKAEVLRELYGLVDIYMPDLKYYSAELSAKYSHAPDYFTVAQAAIGEMLSQVGAPKFDGDRLLSGVIVRHLVLPDCRRDSIELLERLRDTVGQPTNVILSLMSQYTPDFYIQSHPDCTHRALCRRLTSFEYNSVLRRAEELGFEGYFQNASSASSCFTPEF